MPLSLDSSGPVGWITASGPVSYSEILELFQVMILEAPRTGRVPVFVDTRNVTQAPSTPELRLIAREVKHLTDAGFGPIAVLTGSTWMYGVVRMFSVFVQSATDVVALRSTEDAEAWIDNYVALCDARSGTRSLVHGALSPASQTYGADFMRGSG
jgi:hypothetical protein